MVFKWLKICLCCKFYHLCLLLHLYLLLIFKLFLVVKEYACNPEMCMVESGESEFQAHPKPHKKIKSWTEQPEILSQRNSWKRFLSNTQKNLFLHDIFKHLGHCSYSSFISHVSYCSPSYYKKVICFFHNVYMNWCMYVYAFIFI